MLKTTEKSSSTFECAQQPKVGQNTQHSSQRLVLKVPKQKPSTDSIILISLNSLSEMTIKYVVVSIELFLSHFVHFCKV